MLAAQGVPPEESEPYRKALDSDEALRAVYNDYRAIPLWLRERLDPVPMPALQAAPERITPLLLEHLSHHAR